MKKTYKATLGMFIAVLILLIMIAIDQYKGLDHQTEENKKPQEQTIVDTIYVEPKVISKALAMKMIGLIKENKDNISSRDAEVNVKGLNREDWFYKYFNIAIPSGFYIGGENGIKPLDQLTYKEASLVAQHFSVDLNKLGIELSGKEDQAILYKEWLQIFHGIVDQSDQDKQLKEIKLYIFATPALSSELGKWETATDHGKYNFEGLVIDACINKEITAYVKGNDILYIKEIANPQPMLTNAYIVEVNKENNWAEVFMGGVSRKITLDKELKAKNKKGFIADVSISENYLNQIIEKENITKGVISKISNEEVEIVGVGKLLFSEDVKFYDLIEKPKFTNYSAMIVGYDTAVFVLDENQVVAAIIRQKVNIDDIRVVISDTGFKKLFHENVILTSRETYKMEKNKKEQTIKENETSNIEEMSLNIGDRITFIPKEGEKIKITSTRRGAGEGFNPEYRGIIEVEKVPEGYLIINQVDFEEYLYGVVPSEMPASYGIEAAKVQAVCARSYAYNEIHSNRFSKYGAHVDDSTSCQVYNNTQESEISNQGIDATKGQLLSYQGEIISTNFFSTSAGVTANQGEVWANAKEFPTTSAPYLVSVFQNDQDSKILDLSNEENFNKFINNKAYPSYDSQFPWFRWTTKMTAKQIEETINKSIGSRYNTSPNLIKTLDDKDVFRSREVDGIGELLDIWIYSRGKSGIITEMVIQGTKGVYKISTEYNIRALIAPVNYIKGEDPIIITKGDGSTTKDMNLMPSAFYRIDKKFDAKKNLTEVIFYGGGYGHGVGMSQNGAKAMVDLGHNYEEILKYYYQGTDLIYAK